jgi:HEAT repeat protein
VATRNNVREALRAAEESDLLAELQRAANDRKRKIAGELGRRGSRQAVEPLRSLLSSEDADLRASAAQALGKIGDASVGGELTLLLSDEQQPVFVRDTCAYALARLAYAPALDVLRAAAQDAHESIRNCASSAIAAILRSRGEDAVTTGLPLTETHSQKTTAK